MNKKELPINNTLLSWARRDAGLTPEEAAYKAKVTPLKARGNNPAVTSEERLLQWEQGTSNPTLRQLEGLAKAYCKPLLTFFLQTPPVATSSLIDFRTTNTGSKKDSPEFSALKRHLEILQEELKDIFIAENTPELDFVGKYSLQDNVNVIVENIRATLGFSYSDQIQCKDTASLARAIRIHAQEIGIFILYEGNLGSHHSNIAADEFRGMAICDKHAPLININPNDSKAAQLFTLIHELAHIWLGHSAISNYNALDKGLYASEKRIELFCNDISAEFLVPEVQLKKTLAIVAEDTGDIFQLIETIRPKFKVSRAVIARRLLDINIIDSHQYGSVLGVYQKDWNKIKTKSAKNSGPSRNVLDKYRLGTKVINTLLNAVSTGNISLKDASQLMRVKIDRFNRIAG